MDDVIVIGGGPAGEAAAFEATARGGRVTLVERDLVGGECPFWACMPSKTLLNQAARRHGGLDVPWQHASDRRDWMISREGTDYPTDAGHVRNLEAVGARVVKGVARIAGPEQGQRLDGRGSFHYSETPLQADKLLLNRCQLPGNRKRFIDAQKEAHREGSPARAGLTGCTAFHSTGMRTTPHR